jgi:hypothetical protein
MRFNVLPGDTKAQLIDAHKSMTQNALVQVFGQNEQSAATLVRKLWERFADAPSEERDLLMHNDPVALACDLLQVKWSDIDQEKLASFNKSREILLSSGQLGSF